MCFSKESSLTAYVFGTALSILTFFYSKNKYIKHVSIHVFTFVHIQLLEFLIWLDNGCGTLNNISSLLILPFLYIQPATLLLAGYYLDTFHLPRKVIIGLVAIFLYFAVESFILYLPKWRQLCSKPCSKSSGHLSWPAAEDNNKNIVGRIKLIIYIIGLSIPWLFLKNMKLGIFIFGYTMVTLFLARHYDYNKNSIITEYDLLMSWESKWCYIAAVSAIFLFLGAFLTK